MSHTAHVGATRLEIFDDVFEGVVVVMPPRRGDIEHHVVQVPQLLDLGLERVLDAEESLRYLLHPSASRKTTHKNKEKTSCSRLRFRYLIMQQRNIALVTQVSRAMNSPPT